MPADRNVSRPADAQPAHPYRPSKETAKILDQAASLGAVEGGKKPSKKRAPSSAAAPWARSSNHPSLRVSAEPSSRGPSLPAGQDTVVPPIVAAPTSAALDPPAPSGFVVPASPELGSNSFEDSVMDELYPANEPSTTLAAPSLSGPSASLPQGQTNGDGLASTVQPGYFDPSSDLLRPCCKRCAKHYYDDPTQICAPPVPDFLVPWLRDIQIHVDTMKKDDIVAERLLGRLMNRFEKALLEYEIFNKKNPLDQCVGLLRDIRDFAAQRLALERKRSGLVPYLTPRERAIRRHLTNLTSTVIPRFHDMKGVLHVGRAPPRKKKTVVRGECLELPDAEEDDGPAVAPPAVKRRAKKGPAVRPDTFSRKTGSDIPHAQLRKGKGKGKAPPAPRRRAASPPSPEVSHGSADEDEDEAGWRDED
ncbi:MAG: hypothetical protein M1824_001769 [Vezdaea acicularis]|nr:MAG: hypothetical protein M1824_001769 [Vezdaea acicularis]